MVVFHGKPNMMGAIFSLPRVNAWKEFSFTKQDDMAQERLIMFRVYNS